MTDTIKFATVATMTMVHHEQTGRILLVRKPEGATFGGLWTGPGGKVDYNDLHEPLPNLMALESQQYQSTRSDDGLRIYSVAYGGRDTGINCSHWSSGFPLATVR